MTDDERNGVLRDLGDFLEWFELHVEAEGRGGLTSGRMLAEGHRVRDDLLPRLRKLLEPAPSSSPALAFPEEFARRVTEIHRATEGSGVIEMPHLFPDVVLDASPAGEPVRGDGGVPDSSRAGGARPVPETNGGEADGARALQATGSAAGAGHDEGRVLPIGDRVLSGAPQSANLGHLQPVDDGLRCEADVVALFERLGQNTAGLLTFIAEHAGAFLATLTFDGSAVVREGAVIGIEHGMENLPRLAKEDPSEGVRAQATAALEASRRPDSRAAMGEEGRTWQQERAAVVTWLRKMEDDERELGPDARIGDGSVVTLALAANGIEKGRHILLAGDHLQSQGRDAADCTETEHVGNCWRCSPGRNRRSQ